MDWKCYKGHWTLVVGCLGALAADWWLATVKRSYHPLNEQSSPVKGRARWVKFRIANDTHQDDLNIWIQMIVAVKHITCIRLEKFSRTPQGVVAVRHTP